MPVLSGARTDARLYTLGIKNTGIAELASFFSSNGSQCLKSGFFMTWLECLYEYEYVYMRKWSSHD